MQEVWELLYEHVHERLRLACEPTYDMWVTDLLARDTETTADDATDSREGDNSIILIVVVVVVVGFVGGRF